MVQSENKSTFADRIITLIEKAGSASELARSCGVSEGVVRKWAKGQSDPSRTHLINISKGAGVDLKWLITGDKSEAVTKDEFAMVSLYDVAASAGYGSAIDQEQAISQLAFRRDWLKKEGLSSAGLVAIMAYGDSMEPAISDGSLLLVDTAQRQIAGNAIYVLRLDHHLFAKRLQPLMDGTVRVSSDNPAYTQELVAPDNRESLNIIGRVVWAGRRM